MIMTLHHNVQFHHTNQILFKYFFNLKNDINDYDFYYYNEED